MKWRIVETQPGRGQFRVECERGVDRGDGVRECGRSIWERPPAGVMWQWDGNKGSPTITPSIDCQGGCGRHFTVTGGVFQGSLGVSASAPQPFPHQTLSAQPQPSEGGTAGVMACRAEQRGASEWVCDCEKPGPNCKPTGWRAEVPRG